MACRYFGFDAARRRAGRQDRHADPLREPQGGRRRPHRRRCRRLRPLRRPDDRRRLRYRDDARGDIGRGRVPRRRHPSRRGDQPRGARSRRAAALRKVELVEPRNVIGKNTIESIQSGALYGFAAQVDGIGDRIMDEIGEATVVATGGLAAAHRAATRDAITEHEPWLTLHGLRLIFEKNRRVTDLPVPVRGRRARRPSSPRSSPRLEPGTETDRVVSVAGRLMLRAGPGQARLRHAAGLVRPHPAVRTEPEHAAVRRVPRPRPRRLDRRARAR